MGGHVFSNGFLAFAAVVHVRRVDEGDARRLCGFQDFEGFLLVEGIAPFGAQLPGAQADFADGTARFAKDTLLHCALSSLPN